MKVAIIGSGISGLSAAHFLSKKYIVDLFEKNNHFGGHSFTVDIPENNSNKLISLDLGFIVFNKNTYPNLIKFFHDLNVSYEKSNMSFAVSIKNSNIEYSGSGLSGLFVNKLNIININFLKMIKEIIFFYKEAEKINENKYKNQTLGEFLKYKKLSNYFINYHIIPMVASIWSMPPSLAEKMPMNLFLNFFKNHGLFKIKNRLQWYTVTGRNKGYVNKVLQTISGKYCKNDTLKLIENPTIDEQDILSNFKYKKNIAYLHSDDRFMPSRKKAWSSWNSILEKKDINKNCVTYWLNKLQNLKTVNNYFLTLNPIFEIDKNKIIKELEFFHPVYDLKSIDAQKKLNVIQGVYHSWFCGSYFGYGFHEDGLKSAINIVDKI